MPIDDERRRLGRTKTTPGRKSQTIVATEGKSGSKDVQESLQRLQEMLQRQEPAGLHEGEENRIEANKEAAKRAQNERNEKYERLRQAFERMNRWMDEEKAEAAREESRRVQQGMRDLSYLDKDLAQCD